jgi:hypothetical protein
MSANPVSFHVNQSDKTHLKYLVRSLSSAGTERRREERRRKQKIYILIRRKKREEKSSMTKERVLWCVVLSVGQSCVPFSTTARSGLSL